MELQEKLTIQAPRPRVFEALNDPEILRQAIPGCESLEAIGDGAFEAVVSARVGPLKARFKGQVQTSEVVAPESYVLSGEGRGGPAGHAKVRARVELEDNNDTTELAYSVKADIGGKLAQLGGQLVQNTAQKLAAEFFSNFEALVASPAGGDADASTPESGAESLAADSGNRAWLWIAGGIALLVAIAWLAL